MIAFQQVKKHLQTTLFILVAALLFVNTCPVKKAIQSPDYIAGQSKKVAPNKMISASEVCAIDSEIEYASINQASIAWENDFLPLALFTALVSGLFQLFFSRKLTIRYPIGETIWTSPVSLHVKHCVFII